MATSSEQLASMLNFDITDSNALTQALGEYFDERDNSEDETDNEESDTDGE